jgi:hypothetical protein
MLLRHDAKASAPHIRAKSRRAKRERIPRVVVSNLDLRELFQVISNSVRRLMQCDYASLSLPESDDKDMRL